MIFYFQLLIYSIISETPDRNYSRYSYQHEKRFLTQSNLTSYQWDYLRVQFVYIQATLPQEQQTYLNKVFGVAQLFFQKHLLVRRLGYKIQWSSYLGASLFDIQIPLNLRTDSYDTDYVFFINVENSPDADYLAYASPADKDSITLRPILGIISWNMATVNLNSLSDVEFQDSVLTAIHEMTHALGFLPDYFNTFYDFVSGEGYVDGNIYTSYYQYLITPRIRQHVREFFQCFNAIGAQLEDQGGSGSSQSHFERTIFFNELMTAQFMSNGMVITQLSSSFYEDTGFYRLAEYQSDTMTWGGADGCSFLNSTCTGTNFSEFCQDDTKDACSFDNAGISYCTNDTFSNVCKYQQIYQYLSCRDATNPTKQTDRGVFDYFGYDSMCVIGSLTQQAYTYPSACYQYSCDEQNNLLITVNSLNFNCSLKQQFTSSEYFGSITCPKNAQQICQNKNTCVKQCNSKGLCHQGKCLCIEGFSGQGCDQTCTTYRYQQQCLESCPTGTYARDDIKYCLGCPANCKTCNDYKSCLTCNDGYRIRGGFCDYLSVQFTKTDNQFVLPKVTQNSTASLTQNQTISSNNSTSTNQTLNSTTSSSNSSNSTNQTNSNNSSNNTPETTSTTKWQFQIKLLIIFYACI